MNADRQAGAAAQQGSGTPPSSPGSHAQGPTLLDIMSQIDAISAKALDIKAQRDVMADLLRTALDQIDCDTGNTDLDLERRLLKGLMRAAIAKADGK